MAKRRPMLDLDAELEKQGKKDDGSGAAIRNIRFLGMLADVFYRDLREMDVNFVEGYPSALRARARFAR